MRSRLALAGQSVAVHAPVARAIFFALAISCAVQLVVANGRISFSVFAVNNPNGELATGEKCDFGVLGTDRCDTYVDACINVTKSVVTYTDAAGYSVTDVVTKCGVPGQSSRLVDVNTVAYQPPFGLSFVFKGSFKTSAFLTSIQVIDDDTLVVTPQAIANITIWSYELKIGNFNMTTKIGTTGQVLWAYNLTCDPDYYGDSCGTYCSSAVTCSGRGNCTVNGTCVCPSRLRQPSCDDCVSGYYGPDCTLACPVCLNGGTCNGGIRGSGSCACTPGWTGPLCDVTCPAGKYGPNCNITCLCQNGAECDRFTGACACTPGWTGALCNVTCKAQFYGANCSKPCACKNTTSACDRFTGACMCLSGYTGPKCDVPCGTNKYGPNCARTCNCVFGTCDPVVGCLCQAGYGGPTCASTCTDGTYGVGCLRKCSCADKFKCDPTMGCNCYDPGYKTGTNCDVDCPQYEYGPSCPRYFLTSINVDACMAGYYSVDPASPTCDRGCSSTTYGSKCAYACQCQGNSVCDRYTGACTCYLGSNGTLCDKPCPYNTFGLNCALTCNCQNGGYCDRYYGCVCPPGWQGTACRTACAEGFYGMNCTSVCNCRNGANCDRFTGTCACTPGWTNATCSAPCPAGAYGPNCTLSCTCQNGAMCDRFTGACNCTAGWTGNSCDVPCPSGTFGANCSLACTCQNGATCDRFTGCVCAPGYKGTVCDSKCPSGSYGVGCNGTCLCKNGAVCHHATGACDCVVPGWTGPTCNTACAGTGTFGYNCSRPCLCVNGGVCDGVNGSCNCTNPGWQGPVCDVSCSTTQTFGVACTQPCVCKNDGRCDPVSGLCTCPPAWTGMTCETASRPPPPTNATITHASSTEIQLRIDGEGLVDWDYEVKRIGCPIVPSIRIKANTTFFDTRQIIANQEYVYVVTAVNPFDSTGKAVSESLQLPSVLTTKREPPLKPSVLAVATMELDRPVLVLTWVDDPTSAETNTTYITRNDGVVVVLFGNHSYIDRTVLPQTVYTYTLVNENQYGRSDGANTTAKTLPLKSDSPPSDGASSAESGAHSDAGPIAGSIVGAVVVSVGVVAVYVVMRRRRRIMKHELMARSELELIDTVVRRPEIAEIEIPGSCIRLKEKLGEGEYGEVYRADVDLGAHGGMQTAAVKTFKLTSLSSADEIRSARSAFMSEIDLMRTVPKHPHVIALLGVCTQSEPNCAVLEYAEFADLRHYLLKHGSALSAGDLLCFCIDISRGMEHLEKVQIVHRDLAARNCMVVAGPRPPNTQELGWTLGPKANVVIKIADFGLSKDTSVSGDYYQAKTFRKLPVKWWSFGVTAWEVFSRGAKPFPGLQNHEVADHLSRGIRMSSPPGCPPSVFTVIDSCWRKYAETRPHFSQVTVQLRKAMMVLCKGAAAGDDDTIGGALTRENSRADLLAATRNSGVAVAVAASGSGAPTPSESMYFTTLPDAEYTDTGALIRDDSHC